MLDIKIVKTTAPKAKPADESKLGFGKLFSDHMFLMDYTDGEGWHDARIVPYAPFELDPACVVFHYAQEIFEGMKAYRTADNTIQLFRPDCNAKRMQDSSDRLCIPQIPVEDFVQAVKALVEVDKDWVPHTDGASLYIRPFVIASDVGLGVHASKHYIFCIICAPSGAYYAEGINPVRIYVEDEYIRAAPGLTGFTKCGGNYAASIKAGELAEEKGFSQVLWLDERAEGDARLRGAGVRTEVPLCSRPRIRLAHPRPRRCIARQRASPRSLRPWARPERHGCQRTGRITTSPMDTPRSRWRPEIL